MCVTPYHADLGLLLDTVGHFIDNSLWQSIHYSAINALQCHLDLTSVVSFVDRLFICCKDTYSTSYLIGILVSVEIIIVLAFNYSKSCSFVNNLCYLSQEN